MDTHTSNSAKRTKNNSGRRSRNVLPTRIIPGEAIRAAAAAPSHRETTTGDSAAQSGPPCNLYLSDLERNKNRYGRFILDEQDIRDFFAKVQATVKEIKWIYLDPQEQNFTGRYDRTIQ
jgi:hypothetical protein